jgi:hypothetical protein
VYRHTDREIHTDTSCVCVCVCMCVYLPCPSLSIPLRHPTHPFPSPSPSPSLSSVAAATRSLARSLHPYLTRALPPCLTRSLSLSAASLNSPTNSHLSGPVEGVAYTPFLPRNQHLFCTQYNILHKGRVPRTTFFGFRALEIACGKALEEGGCWQVFSNVSTLACFLCKLTM